jgi:maltooligosyltrehalose trehalohydrolase
LKLAAGLEILSPYIPLLFMGEEYAEENAFLYFVSHTDPDLINAVRRGRCHEFRAFAWEEPPPDPQAEQTFLASKLNWEKRRQGRHDIMRNFYRELLHLRKHVPALHKPDKKSMEVQMPEPDNILTLHRRDQSGAVFALFNFSSNPVHLDLHPTENHWEKLLDSAETKWGGSGAMLPQTVERHLTGTMPPWGLVLYQSRKGA